MRKILLLIVSCILLLSSCGKDPDPYAMLSEFSDAYGIEGSIYHPDAHEGQDGYISEEMLRRIFVYHGRFPERYAILLNSHPNFGAECGVFVCESDAEALICEEICLERVKLLGQGSDHTFIKRNRNIVFYSTLNDKEKAKYLWNEIIKNRGK